MKAFLPLTALAVAVGFATLSSRSDDPSTTVVDETGGARADGEPSPDELVAAATGSRSDLVVLVELHAADGSVDRTWIDEATGSNRFLDQDAKGVLVAEKVRAISPAEGDNVQVVDLQVAHADGQYAEMEVASTPAPFTEWGPGAMLRQRVTSGELREDGTEVVDGQELVLLVPSQVPIPCDDFPEGPERDQCLVSEASPDSTSGTGVVWADPGTLRPVKELHAAGTPYEFTSYYRYFERDDKSLDAVAAHVPASYSRVEQIIPEGAGTPADRAGDLVGGGR